MHMFPSLEYYIRIVSPIVDVTKKKNQCADVAVIVEPTSVYVPHEKTQSHFFATRVLQIVTDIIGPVRRYVNYLACRFLDNITGFTRTQSLERWLHRTASFVRWQANRKLPKVYSQLARIYSQLTSQLAVTVFGIFLLAHVRCLSLASYIMLGIHYIESISTSYTMSCNYHMQTSVKCHIG